ncbi:hypothetical protein H0H10_29075 [Streptomyces sp. TRM S81-3]|uniref:Uncharacterized protein n=1 Tax=Streptomyces griseicoloratus TaxID=2752516 RepID=A0A926L5Z1_9ACTN|nr:hypothetical protein [Streptomyces griseicoloratus]MBD0423163.1 hypothetical protein [Streptomyces griseicoloratus]
MSLVEMIAQADARGLAASGLACLDRCIPLLDGDDDVLRPLWATLADGDGQGWGEGLEQVRGKLAGPDAAGEDEAVLLARRMLAAAPAGHAAAEVRVWADACSVASLRIHRLLDPASGDAAGGEVGREGRTEGLSPLVAAELRRQVTVLELLAGHGTAGLRGALEVATEGRRVLRAVVSRRARGRG